MVLNLNISVGSFKFIYICLEIFQYCKYIYYLLLKYEYTLQTCKIS